MLRQFIFSASRADRTLDATLRPVDTGDGVTLLSETGEPHAWEQFVARCHQEGRRISVYAIGWRDVQPHPPRETEDSLVSPNLFPQGTHRHR